MGDAGGLVALLEVGDLVHVVLVDEEEEADLEERVRLEQLVVGTHVGLEHVREVLLAVLKLLRLRVARLLQADEVDGELVLRYPRIERSRRSSVA